MYIRAKFRPLLIGIAFFSAQSILSCNKNADVTPNQNSPVDSVYQFDKIIGTYTATDTLLTLAGMSPLKFDTTISTTNITVSPRGTKMIEFDKILDDNYKLEIHSYCLNSACTYYSYKTERTIVTYDQTYYNYYKVNVSFSGDTLRYKTDNSTEKSLRMGVAIKQ